MLSKSRGQVLRLATVLHMLFNIDTPEVDLSLEVSEQALKAAVNFIKVACQQTAYIAGKGPLTEELEKFKTGEFILGNLFGRGWITHLCFTSEINCMLSYS